MKAGTRSLAVALGAALSLAAGAPLRAAQPCSPLTLKPLAAASLDAGPKHVLGYFVRSGEACRLTLIVLDAPGVESATPATATTRFVVPIDHGQAARVDTAVSKSLRFACAPDAGSMTVTSVERVPPRSVD
jgi:hypothetical protein